MKKNVGSILETVAHEDYVVEKRKFFETEENKAKKLMTLNESLINNSNNNINELRNKIIQLIKRGVIPTIESLVK